MKNKAKGFTLIEIIVVVAILGIISAFGISSFLSVMQSQKAKADEETMHAVETSLRNLFQEPEVFDEIKEIQKTKVGAEKAKLKLNIPIVKQNDTYGANLSTIKVDGKQQLKDVAPITSEYLIESMDSDHLKINIDDYWDTTYEISCTFNGVQLNEARDFAIQNDDVKIIGEFVLPGA